MRTVGQVSDDLGLTVRTLHHYDEIGLVSPSERSPAGYRLYADADLERLQHVVVYRRLGFTLEEIKALLDASGPDVRTHLERQREAVISRLGEQHQLVDAIDRALEKDMTGMQLTPQEQRELFGEGFSEEYASEAQERWGETDVWQQSQRRTSSYTKDDWVAIKAEADAVNEAFVAALSSGEPADGPAGVAAARAHREHLERWFYDVTPEMHRGLADMYVADPRFTASYEALAPGLATYVHDAIRAAAADRSV